jgi:hypothetical protein
MYTLILKQPFKRLTFRWNVRKTGFSSPKIVAAEVQPSPVIICDYPIKESY